MLCHTAIQLFRQRETEQAAHNVVKTRSKVSMTNKNSQIARNFRFFGIAELNACAARFIPTYISDTAARP